MNDDASDHQLMEWAKHDNLDAFGVIVRRYQDALLNYFRRLGANHYAEDCVQETFVRVFRYKDRYQPKAMFTTFLYTLARHVWCDSLRKMQRRGITVEESQIDKEIHDATTSEHARKRIDVQTALILLPEKLRDVVVLSFYQGLRYEEIAQILKVPVGTIKSRMFHAMSQLKEVFHEES